MLSEDLLLELSETPSEVVRAKAASLMGIHPDGRSAKRLVALLEDQDARVRRALTMAIAHILSGEIMIAAIPFTRLIHMIFFPFTRGYIGSEFGGIRHARDW